MTTDQEKAARRQAISEELDRIEESARNSAQNQFEQSKQWRMVNLIIGIPASTLAAVSGVTALAATTGRVAAGIIALVAAALGALLTTINASHRSNQASASGNAYLEIQTGARQARLIDLPSQDLDEARDALQLLTERRNEQNKTAEPPNRLARWRAKKNLVSGDQDYNIDKD